MSSFRKLLSTVGSTHNRLVRVIGDAGINPVNGLGSVRVVDLATGQTNIVSPIFLRATNLADWSLKRPPVRVRDDEHLHSPGGNVVANLANNYTGQDTLPGFEEFGYCNSEITMLDLMTSGI